MLLTLLSISSLALITQIAADSIPIKSESGKQDFTLVFAPSNQGKSWTVVEHKIADLKNKDVAFGPKFAGDTYVLGNYQLKDIPSYGPGYLYAADSTKLPNQLRFGDYANCQVGQDKDMFAAFCTTA